jgi:predicted nucleic acid-binding protein
LLEGGFEQMGEVDSLPGEDVFDGENLDAREGLSVLVRREMSKFEVFDTGGTELAVASAQNYRLLRTRGLTIRKTIDCLIATFCLMAGHSLLHRDHDFDPFEKQLGLRVLHPPKR